ncbi:MAG: sigma-70 family RNA polymerase sigma factor [Cyanobacteria bacterium]|nr:sigma-70 family RNA polymerase sigma factor [Cyanobacteriota bacterium]
MTREQERRVADVVDREQSRLRNFIRRRVADPRDVEDILQDVFAELVEANQLLMPIDHLTGWLFRVARNRIIDLFRRKKPDRFDDESEALLPSAEAGPDAAYARSVLLDELEHAIGELPQEQRDVFIAHEIDGESFREISVRTGVNVNTLLSRKRYAVMQLRRSLQGVYDELTNR